jgi:hypothetical protein
MLENVNTYTSLFKLVYSTTCKPGTSNSLNLCSASANTRLKPLPSFFQSPEAHLW